MFLDQTICLALLFVRFQTVIDVKTKILLLFLFLAQTICISLLFATFSSNSFVTCSIKLFLHTTFYHIKGPPLTKLSGSAHGKHVETIIFEQEYFCKFTPDCEITQLPILTYIVNSVAIFNSN